MEFALKKYILPLSWQPLAIAVQRRPRTTALTAVRMPSMVNSYSAENLTRLTCSNGSTWYYSVTLKACRQAEIY